MRHTGTFATLLVIAATALGCGRIVSAQEIEGIYLRGKGSLAMLNFRYVPQLLFDNGEVYTDIAIPPEDLDIAASKQAEPERWGRWRNEGDDVYFDLPSGKKKVKLYKNPAVPADDGLKLEGVWAYQYASVSLDQSSSVVIERDIGFSGNGVFATGSFSGGSGSSGGGGSVTGYSQSGLSPQGTYRISNYAIEFERTDGAVERKLFFFYPTNDGGPDYETINVGASHYLQKADSFNAEIEEAPSTQQAGQTAARPTSSGDGIPITPGRWQMESFAPDGELTDTSDYCQTTTAFDPGDFLEKELFFDHCEAGPQEISGQHGVYNMACVSEGSEPIGFKFDLTIEDGEGDGKVIMAEHRDGNYVASEPFGLRMRRSGDC